MLQRFSRLLKTVAEKIYISPIILAFLFFLVVALAVTYPFVTSPKHTLTAPLASDTTSSVIQYEAFVREGLNPFTSTEYRLVGQPDGIPIAPGVNRVSFLSVLLLWVNSSLFGAITAHSLQTVTGFLLTAFITFLFVRSVTKSSAAGVVGGLIYGFWPQILGLGRAAPTYTHMWLFILPLWAFWSLAANGLSKRRVVLAALSVVPAIFWTPYYAFHILLVGGTCLGIASLVLYKNAGLKKTALLIFVVLGSWFIAYGAYIVVGMTAPASEVPVRTIEEAYQQSAHPLMYLLPGEYTHWGSALNTALLRAVPRALNTNLYLGLSTLALACIGFLALSKRLDMFTLSPSRRLRIALYMGGAVAFVCFIFSLPPTIAIQSLSIPTPNDLVVSVMPALRAGQRLVMPLMAGVTLMAAISIYMIAQKQSGRIKYLILAVLAAMVMFDLWTPYPDTTTKITATPAISQLRWLPDGRVAQYQANSLVGYPAQTFCLTQAHHRKPIVNDCGLGRNELDPATPSPYLAKIIHLPICEQKEALKEVKVRYVIVPTADKETLQCYSRPALADTTYRIFKL